MLMLPRAQFIQVAIVVGGRNFFCGSVLVVSSICMVDDSSLWFQVAGIMDAILHNTIRLMKKVELGKNF